jgi:2-C-methyl-D-erythritol 4-phosphate cytidylyltransferase
MGSALRKQYLCLNGRPMLAHTLTAFDQCPRIDHIVVVVPEDELFFCRQEIMAPLRVSTPVVLTAGGRRRQDSVYNGLEALNQEGVVLVHDGVRPLISRTLIESCIEGVLRWDACVPVITVNDTLKKIDRQGFIEKTVSREGLTMAQTPQGFRISLIKRAHHLARRNGWEATDDASLVERSGVAVHTIPGSPLNIKITTTVDLRWAEAMFDLRFDL